MAKAGDITFGLQVLPVTSGYSQVVGSTTNDVVTITTTATGTSDPWYWYSGNIHYGFVPWTPIKEEGEKMNRGLYEVVLVDPEDDAVESYYVVASDEGKAKVKAMRLYDGTKDVDDIDVIVRRLGDVRQKRVVQEVKVVKDD
jgi:hypothetical protein